MNGAFRRWRERRRLLREAARFDAMVTALAGLSAEPRLRQHAAALRREAGGLADWLRRWLDGRRRRAALLREAERLQAEARRRALSWTGAVYSISAIAAAAIGSPDVRDFASDQARRYRDETEALWAKARALREEASRLG